MSIVRGRRAIGEAVQPTTRLAAATLSIATAVGMCRVFTGWDFLAPLLVVVCAVHLGAALSRVVRTPIAVEFGVLVLVVLELVAVIRHGGTTTFGWPSGSTFEALRADLQVVVDQFPTAVAPVDPDAGWGTAVALLLGLTAVVTDVVATRTGGRLEVLAPSAAVFVVVGVLGDDRNRIAVAGVWVAAALVLIGVLRFRDASTSISWMGGRSLRPVAAVPALVVVAIVSATAGSLAAPSLPGAGAEGWLDHHGLGGSVTEVVSPFVDIGSRLRDRSDQELFSVESNAGGRYWRLMGLSVYDGSAWQPAEENLGDPSDLEPPVGAVVQSVSQTIRVEALAGHVVPAAHRAVQVQPDVIEWAPGSESLVLPDSELQRGDTIGVRSQVVVPVPDLLRSLGVSTAPEDEFLLPADVPVSAVEAALVVTATAATPYDKALALQTWFRTEFEYDITVDYGNSTDAISAFLADRRGFCQQFAGTFAVMARSIGLPARVAVGFTPGELGADGRYHVYGRHAHAWPEVWFDGIGWVSFEPTPGRGNVDTAPYTGVAADQDDTAAAVTTTTSVATESSTSTTDGTATTDTDGEDDTPSPDVGGGDTTGGSGDDEGGRSAVLVWVLAVLLAGVLWTLAMPRVVAAAVRRGHRDPVGRVGDAWRRSVAVLGLVGAPGVSGRTPDEHAVTVAAALTDRLGEHPHQIGELAQCVVVAVYAPVVTSDADARRAERLADEITSWSRDRFRPTTRLRLRLDPRMVRRTLGG